MLMIQAVYDVNVLHSLHIWSIVPAQHSRCFEYEDLYRLTKRSANKENKTSADLTANWNEFYVIVFAFFLLTRLTKVRAPWHPVKWE